MHTVQINRRKSLWLIISLATILTFVLTACGTNSGSRSSSTSTGTTPVSTVTSALNPHGCTSNAVVETSATQPNIVLKPPNHNAAVAAHQRDLIQVQPPVWQ